jgi:colanic acid/amylovoran biosynthesis glycosyltransferase
MSRREPGRVAVLTSRFPKLSETFILNEILELTRTGTPVEVFPLLRERAEVVQPAAAELDRTAHHMRLLSAELIGAQLWWLRRSPRRYLRVWARALAGNARSPGFLARSLFVIPKAAAFARRMRRLGVTHIHAHWATHPTLAAWAASELTGIPYSFTAHAHDVYVDRTMLEEKIAGARFVRTISEHNRELLGGLYGPSAAAKIVVIGYGIDTERFRPRSGDARAEQDAFTLVCVASLQDYKGHRYLLDAVAQTGRRPEDLRCLLIGEGELRPEIEARCEELGLDGRIVLCGGQPADRVSEILAGADGFVLPSIVTDTGKMEGVPNALMEAMASGLPVIATDISGVGELVEHERTGLLVAQRDPDALAAAISRLVDDAELRSRLAEQGRRRVLERYELRSNVARLRAALVA